MLLLLSHEEEEYEEEEYEEEEYEEEEEQTYASSRSLGTENKERKNERF